MRGVAEGPWSETNHFPGFFAQEGNGPFNFWFAHPPDAKDPTVGIIWMAEKPGQHAEDGKGALLYIEAENNSPESLAHLRRLKRGDRGTLTFLVDRWRPVRVKIGDDTYLLRRFIVWR